MKIKLITLNLSLHGEEAAPVGGIATTSAIDSQTTAEPVVVYGKPDAEPVDTSKAPAEPVVDRNAEWKNVKEKFKDMFESDFKSNMDRRLKGKNTEIGTMRSVVDPLLKYFGLSDMNDLKKFVDADIIPQIDGYTPTAYDPDAEPGDGDAKPAPETIRSAADLTNEGIALGDKLKAIGVDFDLQKEIDNPAVSELLKRGLTLEQSYTLAHHDEILLRETQKAATAQKAATIEAIRTKGLDHVTEVASKPAPKVVHKTDPSTFTDEDFENIKKRVQRGEKITL